MFKRYIIAAACFALSACNASINAPAPATAPTTADLTAEIQAEAALNNVTPMDIWNIGVRINLDRCAAYFNPLATQAATLKMAGQEAGLAGSAATGALGLSGAGTGTAAIVGLMSALFPQALDTYGNAQTGGLPPGAMYSLVQNAQTAYIGGVATPASVTEALVDVSGLANICGPAKIQSLGLQAILNAKPTATTITNLPTALKLGAQPDLGRVHAPPVVNVH